MEVQFSRWASTLKEYPLTGFAMDDKPLKNPDGRPDFFDEMLAADHQVEASLQALKARIKERKK